MAIRKQALLKSSINYLGSSTNKNALLKNTGPCFSFVNDDFRVQDDEESCPFNGGIKPITDSASYIEMVPIQIFL